MSKRFQSSALSQAIHQFCVLLRKTPCQALINEMYARYNAIAKAEAATNFGLGCTKALEEDFTAWVAAAYIHRLHAYRIHQAVSGRAVKLQEDYWSDGGEYLTYLYYASPHASLQEIRESLETHLPHCRIRDIPDEQRDAIRPLRPGDVIQPLSTGLCHVVLGIGFELVYPPQSFVKVLS